MSEDTYNGWANRETWALALHLDNDQGLQDTAREIAATAVADADAVVGSGYADEQAGRAIVEWVQGDIPEWYDENLPDWYLSLLADVGSFWRIDLAELGAAFLDENPYLDGEGE